MEQCSSPYICMFVHSAVMDVFNILISHEKLESFSLGVCVWGGGGVKDQKVCYETMVYTRYSTVATGTETIFHLS